MRSKLVLLAILVGYSLWFYVGYQFAKSRIPQTIIYYEHFPEYNSLDHWV